MLVVPLSSEDTPSRAPVSPVLSDLVQTCLLVLKTVVEPLSGKSGTCTPEHSVGEDALLLRNLWEQEVSFYCANPPRLGAYLSMTPELS